MENTGTLKVALARRISKPFYINKCKNSKSLNICGSERRGGWVPRGFWQKLLNVWEQRWQVWWPAQPCSGISPGLVILCGISIRILVKS